MEIEFLKTIMKTAFHFMFDSEMERNMYPKNFTLVSN